MQHKLKSWPEFFNPIHARDCRFDIRVNDRNFQVGDLLVFEEWVPEQGVNELLTFVPPELKKRNGSYTGRTAWRVVKHISDLYQQPGVIVMSLE